MYNKMLEVGLLPDNYSLPYVLKACAYLQNCKLGEQVHGDVLKLGFLYDIFVGNTLILMYSSCGSMVEGGKLFDEMPMRTAVSWTVMISGYAKKGDVENARFIFDNAPIKDIVIWGSMISGYVQNNCFKEGLEMFRLMQAANKQPDEAVFVSVLCACAHLGAMDIGMWIHKYLDRIGLSMGIRLSTALIDMYARCGNLPLAKKLFDGMEERDTISWNVMISGLAMHGDGKNALKLFSEMEKAGFRPNDITFIAVFTACSYSGVALEGLQIFNHMITVYGIQPKSEHFGCMVDFLSRGGHFEEAIELMEKVPTSVSPSEEAIAWRALLTACCDHREARLAGVAAERLFQLEPHSGAYVLLSNMYAADGKYDDSKGIRNIMMDRMVEKTPGSSSIEINGLVHEFVAGEETHPQLVDICKLIEMLNMQLDV
ncbi:Pentatricopeptide repeat-containing protein [Thalictrum thalictroides]|uniref:Pentatricopeptide repeat-containing protein n=1 Tax=Thalictrum thalictroides TaxID=46969 RepID=A0A7J6W2P6_THATH|nr:Pentatricopeptide repeat-containing protein [Thalictrum thalictroides]